MKITLRIFSLILVSVFLLSVVACSSVDSDDGKDKGDTSVTTAQQIEDPNGISQLYRDLEDSLPSLNFGGETIRFLTLKNRGSTTGNVYDDEIWVDELTSEPLNDSIYNRNMYVMERLNCKIENELAVAADLNKMLEKTHFADEDVYQVVGFEAAPALNLGLDSYFYDLTNLETDYIDFDAPWWSGQFFESTNANGKIFALAGSLSLSMARSIYVTYFNKRIAEAYNVENLYTVTNDGLWTIDYQTQLVSGMYRDVNGNDTKDIEDEYGFCTPKYWSTDSYWSAFDIDILSRNEYGDFEFVLNSEKAYDGLLKIIALYYGEGAYHYSNTGDMFVSGNVFMTTQQISYAETPEFRNMQDDYGILPMPKFDEKQSEYYSMPYEIFQTYSVPRTTARTDMATAVLEALCAETWRKIIPTYSELVLKGKYLNDPQSRDMFDMIISNTKIDAGIMYYIKISNIASALYRYPIEINDPGNFSSELASKSKNMKLFIKNLNELASKE